MEDLKEYGDIEDEGTEDQEDYEILERDKVGLQKIYDRIDKMLN